MTDAIWEAYDVINQGAMAHFRFGGGASGTILNPLTMVLMVIAVVLILSRPRNKAITPFLLAYFTIPVEQVVVLGGLHFTVLQILILTVLAKMVTLRTSQGRFAGGFNALDKVVMLWSLWELVAFVVQWKEIKLGRQALPVIDHPPKRIGLDAAS